MSSPSPSTMIIGKYSIGKLLGVGAFGEVRLCVDVHSGKKFAIKMISKCQINDIGEAERVSREFFILTSLQHKNVIELHDVLQDKQRLFLVMELASGGSLDAVLRLIETSGERMEEERARHIFTQIVTAVRYCHRKHVLHRDLKPENVLLDYSEDGTEVIKVADFGLSATVSYGFRPVTPACTPCYAAPELLFPHFFPGLATTNNVGLHKVRFAKTFPEVCNNPIGGRIEGVEEYIKPSTPPQDPGLVDIWSLGVILFRMTQGKLPFAIDSLRALRASHLAWSSALSSFEMATMNKKNTRSSLPSLPSSSLLYLSSPSSSTTTHFLPPSFSPQATSFKGRATPLPPLMLPPWQCLLEPSGKEPLELSSPTMSASLRNLLTGMLQTDPSRRMSGDSVATHTWCAGHSVTSDAHLSRIHSQAVILERNAALEAILPADRMPTERETALLATGDMEQNNPSSLFNLVNKTVILDPIQSRRPSLGLPSTIPSRRLSITSITDEESLGAKRSSLVTLTPLNTIPFQSNVAVDVASIMVDPLGGLHEGLGEEPHVKKEAAAQRRYSLPLNSPVIRVQRRSSMPRLSPIMVNDDVRRCMQMTALARL